MGVNVVVVILVLIALALLAFAFWINRRTRAEREAPPAYDWVGTGRSVRATARRLDEAAANSLLEATRNLAASAAAAGEATCSGMTEPETTYVVAANYDVALAAAIAHRLHPLHWAFVASGATLRGIKRPTVLRVAGWLKNPHFTEINDALVRERAQITDVELPL